MSGENVVSLHETKDADETVIIAGVDAALVTTLEDGRQIQMRTTFPQGAPRSEIDATFDKLFGVVDRQKARYELSALRKDVTKHRKMLRNQEHDIARLDQQHEVKMAEIAAQAEALNVDQDRVYNAAVEQHNASGKKGQFKPQGHTAARLDGIDAQRRKLAEERDRAESERATAFQNYKVSGDRFREEIATLESEIAERERIIGG